jgi:hypothetical protein
VRIFLFITAILAALISFGCGDMPPAANAPANTAGNASANKPPPSTPSPANTSMYGNSNSAANSPITYPEKSAGNFSAANSVSNEKVRPNVKAKATSANSTEDRPQPVEAEKKDESLFSFPPPKPTSFIILDVAKLDRQQPGSFGGMAGKLSGALKNAGYSSEEYSYFWNNSEEFAIVTKMERITSEGFPLPEDRWDDSEQFPVAKDIWDYSGYLIGGKKVYYRVLAFVVTGKNYNFYKSSPPSFEVARDWMSKGFSILGGDSPANPGSGVENVALTGEHHCYVLLYLFVNHTSLEHPKSVDKLEGMEESLKSGLNEEVQKHLCHTKIIEPGDCNQ